MNRQMPVWIIVIVFLLSLTACGGDEGEPRVARWPLSVYSVKGSEKQADRVAVLSQAEAVRVLKEEDGQSFIRMAGGKEGWAKSEHLALQALVITDEGIGMYKRPAVSSGKAYGADNIRKAHVVFVFEEQENAEGKWVKVQGGANSNPGFKWVDGWIKVGSGYTDNAESVARALELAEAVRKKDREALEDLVNESGAVGEAAAAALVDLEPVEDEEAAPTEENGDDAPDSGDTTTEDISG